MYLLPFLGIRLIPGEAGLAPLFLTIFIFNPIITVVTGYFSGRHLKENWYLPLIPATAFLLSGPIMFEESIFAGFAFYALIYLALGYIVMLVTWMISKML